MALPLPPGIDQSSLSQALQECRDVVGDEWVFSSEQDVVLYRDAYTPFWDEEQDPLPSAAVAPDTVEQVQDLIRIANRYQLPLWTISTGRNLGYGGSAPLLSGSVVLDLKRMNRVLEVNEDNHYCVVEPGVSYFDLYRHIQERGLKVWIDPPDPGWGSPIGNSLDRGGGQTPMRDHFAAQCGMEVVLPNGELMRTGMGAIPDGKTWQQYKYGFGPYIDGMFSQSNFGVVTKMGVWLYPEPEAFLSGTLSLAKRDDVHEYVRILSYLVNSGIVQGTAGISSPLVNAISASEDPQIRALFAHFGDPVVPVELERFAEQSGLPFWSSTELRFYGPTKVIEAQWEYAQQRFAVIPGVEFQPGRSFQFPLSDEDLAEIVDPVFLGVPSLQIFRGQTGHMFFSPIIPMTGEAVLEVHRVLSNALEEMGLDAADYPTIALPQSFYPRCFLILLVFRIPEDVEINRKNREIFKQLVKVAADHGWGEYRTHTAFMDDVMGAFSFNNHALLRFHETVKDAVDPNGILSPGKSGIWPKKFRNA